MGALASFIGMVLVATAPTVALEHYVSATADSSAIHIVTAAGITTVLARDPEQVGFDQVMVSPDGRSVGWLALYPNGSTSYPIPLELQIYSGGRRRSYTGIDMPVWRWRYTDGGRRIAFEQETVHGGFGVHYELHDVASGRLIAAHDPPADSLGRALAQPRPPAWVAELDAKR